MSVIFFSLSYYLLNLWWWCLCFWPFLDELLVVKLISCFSIGIGGNGSPTLGLFPLLGKVAQDGAGKYSWCCILVPGDWTKLGELGANWWCCIGLWFVVVFIDWEPFDSNILSRASGLSTVLCGGLLFFLRMNVTIRIRKTRTKAPRHATMIMSVSFDKVRGLVIWPEIRKKKQDCKAVKVL